MYSSLCQESGSLQCKAVSAKATLGKLNFSSDVNNVISETGKGRIRILSSEKGFPMKRQQFKRLYYIEGNFTS